MSFLKHEKYDTLFLSPHFTLIYTNITKMMNHNHHKDHFTQETNMTPTFDYQDYQ